LTEAAETQPFVSQEQIMILRRGSSGDIVSRIQARLWELGFYKGPIDGAFGGGTESAVKSLQKREGITVDGAVGRETWAKLFPGEALPVSTMLAQPVSFRCLALSGSFETSSSPPECFCGIAGDFDGQGISFGALQWNFGQGSLQPLLKRMLAGHPDLCETVFHEHIPVLDAVLKSSRHEQLAFCRSIQDLRFLVTEPWRGMFRTLGRTPEFQAMQLAEVAATYTRAAALAADYGLKSERGVALMFDILVQNGSISELVRAQIFHDFTEISASDETEREVARMCIIAERRAAAAKQHFVADVRARKMTIALGSGTVHGVPYHLEEQFGIRLEPVAAIWRTT
jgi:hypothetical protein